MTFNSFFGRIGLWEEQRWPWIVIAILSASLVLIAHNVFQVWLYMKPCEQCVYIRFAFLCMTFGCLFPIVFPKSLACRIISYVCGVYGCIYGIMCSVKLQSIHAAIHSDDLDAMFGMQGCSTEPHFPFGLPLEKWAPAWFQPTGDCGYDAPVVPDGAVLSDLQRWFIELYQSSDGWYLIPQWKFMDMASCCLLACIVAAIFLAAMIFGWVMRDFVKKA